MVITSDCLSEDSGSIPDKTVLRGVRQVVKALAFHASIAGFDSRTPYT